MVFKFNQCIDCEREWSTKDVKAGKWYKVQDSEVVRWVCHRCTARMWRKAASLYQDVDHHFGKLEFKSDIHKCLEYHKKRHPPRDMPEDALMANTS